MAKTKTVSPGTKRGAEFFQRVERTLFMCDIAGWMKSFRDHSDEDMVRVANEFYRACTLAVEDGDGVVVKFMGDACLALFAPDASGVKGAIKAAQAIERELRDIAKHNNLKVGLGVKIHRAFVCEGVFGIGELARLDVLGRAVNELFLMPNGEGITLSQSARETLPPADRAAWQPIPQPPVAFRKP